MTELIFGMQQPFERIAVLTPLGIRFWDPARDTQVSDNLIVTARPEMMSGPITTAFRTASGVYAFQGLSGLHALEHPVGDPVIGTSPTDKKRFIIEVKDQLGRFLPTAFEVDVPYEGVYPVASQGSPPGNGPPGFYLFSAPTRSVSPGLAVVRGDLVEHSTECPAAHAVLEAQVEGKKWYGVADKRGCVATLFPYPGFIGRLSDSPIEIPLSQQQWRLTVRVRYSPTALTFPPGAEIPYLRSIFNQPPGLIWSTQAGPAVTEWSLDLIFGQELVMRTDNRSTLWISPGASPP